MNELNQIFPIILYILGAILLVVLIVLAFRLMKTLTKLDEVIDDINMKSKKLNGVFDIIDSAADTVSFISDHFANSISNMFSNVFGWMKRRKKRKKEEEEIYE